MIWGLRFGGTVLVKPYQTNFITVMVKKYILKIYSKHSLMSLEQSFWSFFHTQLTTDMLHVLAGVGRSIADEIMRDLKLPGWSLFHVQDQQ